MITLQDQEIFAGIYTKYFPRLVVFARSFILDTQPAQSAEDIVQDVFLKLHRSDNEFNTELQLRSFLYKTVRNRAIDLLRAQQRKDGLIEHYYTENDTLNDQLDGDLLYLLAQSLQDLPPQSRKVISLLFENDLSYKDAAAALDISPNTVKNMRKFALDLLRKKFSGRKMLTVFLQTTRLIPGT